MYSISTFRENIKEAFDKALNNEPVIIIRGGVSYSLRAELTTYSRRGAVTMTKGIDPAYVNMEYPKISKIASNVARKQNTFAAVGIRTTTESNLDLQKDRAVVTVTVKPNEEDVKAYKSKLVEPIIESGKVIKVQTKKDDKTYDFCKHDALKGFCKLGCK